MRRRPRQEIVASAHGANPGRGKAMNERLVGWLLVLVTAGALAAQPEEVPAKERARLETKANRLHLEAGRLRQEGKFLEALEKARESLALHQKLYPPTQFPAGHPNLARSLNEMG